MQAPQLQAISHLNVLLHGSGLKGEDKGKENEEKKRCKQQRGGGGGGGGDR